MARNAQVTLFIILGIMILLSFILIFYLGNGISFIKPKLDASIPSNYIENSLRLTAKHCINKIGMQGGRYIPQNFLAKQYSKIEYAYLVNDNFLSSDELKAEIENCIQDNILACINDFKDFKKIGYNIEYGNLEPKIVLAAGDTPISANFNVNIKAKDQSSNFNNFKADNVMARLKFLHNITKTITDLRKKQIKSSDFYLDYLGSININSSIYEEENNQQVYSLIDQKSRIDNKDYFFLFSNNFENE